MSVRVRRWAWISLCLLAGASLLRSSMALSVPTFVPHPTLNFRLLDGPAAPEPGPRSDLWAIQGPSFGSWKQAEAALPAMVPSGSGRVPDGFVAMALVVKVGRQHPEPVVTNALTSDDLVYALNLQLAPTDVVEPALGSPLVPGSRFRVIRIREAVRTVTESLPYETLIQYSKDLDPGVTQVLTPGQPGSVLRTYQITRRNGRVVSRILLTENVLTQPVDQVELQGGTGTPQHGTQVGQASWYDFCKVDGNYAAHLTLPFGTVVTVTNQDNGKTVTVVINDRGPYGVPGRIIDLCDSAFAQIAPLSQGVANVSISW